MAGAARGACSVLAALALAACVDAEQYGGGAMPQYGAADYERDYHARSPDAPAPLDYKYQEEPRGESEKPVKFTEEVDRWRKTSGRVQRRPARGDAEDELESRGLETETRSGRHRRKRRNRGRRDESRHEQHAPRRRPPLKPSASRPKDNPQRDPYLNSIDYRDDVNKYLEDNERIPSIKTPAKVLGRKPRQRVYVPAPPDLTATKASEDVPLEEDEEKVVHDVKDKVKDEIKDDLEYISGDESDRAGPAGRDQPVAPRDRVRATLPNVEPESRTVAETEDTMREWRPQPTGNYPEYHDYRDMKHIEHIKNKLPSLLRRPPSTTTLPSLQRYSPGRVRPWPGRRAGQLGNVPLEEPPATRFTDPPAVEPPQELDTDPPRTTPTSVESSAPLTTTNTAMTTNNVTFPPVGFISNVTGSELSMAEKSRLSIMKKAQMKENSGKIATRKPPVLLHVTRNQVPTVVMVAADAGDPWQRAQEVAGDSPATLVKVKRLMRQKLVSGAKSIRDLTDNWDEVVCDYIDVEMLDSMPDGTLRSPTPAPLCAAVCALCFLLVL